MSNFDKASPFTIHDEIVRRWKRLEIEIARKDDWQVASLSVFRRHLRYPIQFRQQNLDLSESYVLTFGIVQQMSCSHTDLHRRVMYQLKFANNRNVLSVEQLKRKKSINWFALKGRHSSSPQFPAARTRFCGLQWDKTSLVGRKLRNRPAEKEQRTVNKLKHFELNLEALWPRAWISHWTSLSLVIESTSGWLDLSGYTNLVARSLLVNDFVVQTSKALFDIRQVSVLYFLKNWRSS